MSYNDFWFYFLFIFAFLLIVSYLFKKYKYVNIILPYKWNFKLFSYIQYFLVFLMVFIILLLPFNIWIYQWTVITKKPTLNIEILFDVSLSMTANDIKPNRFEASKLSLITFIKKLWLDYNVWMITFSWVPFVYIPISNDKKAIIWKLKNMKMSDFPPKLDFVWTAIWDAILLGVNELNLYTKNTEKPWVIVLFTDGDSNKWVDPLKAVAYAEKYNIPIFVWAIWNKKNFLIWKDKFWRDVPTNIDLDILKKIAEKSGWEFLKIESKEDFLKILSKFYSYLKQFDKLEKKAVYLYINYYLKIFLFILLSIYFLMFVLFKIKK